MMRRFNQSRGFTLIEALVYIAILSVLSAGSVTLLFSLEEFYYQYQLKQALLESGTLTMERVLTELRQADSIDLTTSELATSTAGVLALVRGATTTTFSIENGSLSLTQNGRSHGDLTSDAVAATGFTVFRYPMGTGELVRVRLTLAGAVGEYQEHATFYTAAIIRGTYGD